MRRLVIEFDREMTPQEREAIADFIEERLRMNSWDKPTEFDWEWQDA